MLSVSELLLLFSKAFLKQSYSSQAEVLEMCFQTDLAGFRGRFLSDKTWSFTTSSPLFNSGRKILIDLELCAFQHNSQEGMKVEERREWAEGLVSLLKLVVPIMFFFANHSRFPPELSIVSPYRIRKWAHASQHDIPRFLRQTYRLNPTHLANKHIRINSLSS